MTKRVTLTLGVAALCVAMGSSNAFAQAHMLRGDSNDDTGIDIADGVYTLAFLFAGGDEPPCMDAADFNDSGGLDLSDAVATFNWLFLGGTPPAAPYPTYELDGAAGSSAGDGLGCRGDKIVEVSGDITSNTRWFRENIYLLKSGVFVRSGATLTIEAGTTVLGESASNGFLVIDQGARIDAVGTRTHPIVFTSDQVAGQRRRADWGGLIFLGYGENNNLESGKEGVPEGLTGQERWGGGDNIRRDDNSGRMSYVRVEFGGTEISEDNEINAVSMFGCGSATAFDHVMVKYNLDDGFEWFGGDATLKYGLAYGIGDDDFDYSFGWNGKGQFWVGQKNGVGGEGERGFEVDNNENTFSNTPLTNPMISNVTLIGDPNGDENDSGFILRRGAGGRVYNALFAGWSDAGVDIDDAITTANNPADGTLVLAYSTGWDNNVVCEDGDADETDDTLDPPFLYTSCEFWSELNEENIASTEAIFSENVYVPGHDFVPTAAGLAGAAFDATTLDDFFDAAPYRGGVDPDSDWTKAPWISYEDS